MNFFVGTSTPLMMAGESLRACALTALTGLAAMGSIWCGGHGLAQLWLLSCQPRLEQRAQQRRVAREAARGIAEIEAYLVSATRQH